MVQDMLRAWAARHPDLRRTQSHFGAGKSPIRKRPNLKQLRRELFPSQSQIGPKIAKSNQKQDKTANNPKGQLVPV
jgi:hypothetical protein